MAALTIGVVGSSLKENERRVPIHPQHIDWLAEEVRAQLVFEHGTWPQIPVTFDARTGLVLHSKVRCTL